MSYKVTETDNYEVVISTDGKRGYFEHLILGEEKGGGLWFDNGKIYDYDGVYTLPKEVVDELKNRGVNTSYLED